MTNAVITLRVPEKDKSLLELVCDARGENISVFLRRSYKKELAALGYFENGTVKALGIRTDSNNPDKLGVPH